MIYNKQLPKIDNINRFAHEIHSFPVSAGVLQKIAGEKGDDLLDFLRLFPSDVMFESRDELATRLEELKFLVEEERKMPEEHLKSPQE